MRRHQCIDGVLGAARLRVPDGRPHHSFEIADAPVTGHRRSGPEPPGGLAIGGYMLLFNVKSLGRHQ
jgi:hypothetical protein